MNTPPSRDPLLMRRLCRMMEQCRVHSLGTEAMLAGALAGLLPEDALISRVDDAAVRPVLQIQSAGKRDTRSPIPVILECGPHPVKHALDAATQIAFGTGIALWRQAREEAGIVLTLCGETPNLHDTRKALHIAAGRKLPLVIVTEHNMAGRKSTAHHGARDLVPAARSLGVPAMSVDGSDAMAVYRVTQEALYRARHSRGPTLIECKTWRPLSKKTPALPPPQLRHWVQGDPLEYMERQMKARGF